MVATLPVSYTSAPYILAALPEIGSVSAITSATIALYAGRAEAEINGKLVLRYGLPFTVDVPLLTALATDLTLYYLMGRKPMTGAQSKSDPWLEKYREARDLLDEIAEGKVRLVTSSSELVGFSQDSNVMQVWSNTKTYRPTTDERSPETWTTDSDKIDDIEDDKT